MQYPFFPTISVGKRFFIFNSLCDNELPGATETYATAQDILNSGISALKPADDNESQTTIDTALTFLNMAYKTELATEKNFYQTHLLNNQDIPEHYRQKIANLISETNFDYLSFINILKEIELGEKQWKQQLKEIRQQAEHFNTALNSYEQKIGKFDMRIQGSDAVKTLIGQLYKDPDILYKEQNSSWQRALHRIQTFSNAALGSMRSQDSAELIQLIKDNFNLLLGQPDIKLTLPQKIAFISEMSEQIAQEVYSIQEDNSTTILNLDTANELIHLLEQDDKTPIDNLHIENIKRKAKSLLNNLEILEQQGELILPSVKGKISYNANTKNIVGLTKDLRKKLAQILEDDTLGKMAELNFTGKDGIKNKKKFLEQLKIAIKKAYGKDEYGENIIKALNKAQLVDRINELLSTRGRLKISVETEISSARTINQLFGSKQMNSKLIAALNGKADSIHIGYAVGDIEMPNNISQDITKEVSTIYEEVYEQAYKETIRSLQSMSYALPTASKAEHEYQKLFQSTSAYSSYADSIANQKANQAALDALQSRILNLEQLPTEAYDKMFDLSKLFKIENSVKYARYYLNDYGFHGGSLGASLIEQLMNLNNIMSQAGISNRLDIDWLTFAILNAGDGMIGYGNRTAIEDYLSGFAAILMFRTGGELAKQVKMNMEQQMITSADTMRLYTFQSMYVPSSFILKTTYDALMQAYNTIITSARGSQVLIINPVTEKDKVNSHLVDKLYDQRGQAWYETAAANFSKVSLEERLLVGFLDVLEELETIMNKT